MAKESQPKVEEKPVRDPLIITRAELGKLSEDDKQAFRLKGGTVTENPAK